MTKAVTKGVVCMAVDAITECEDTIQRMTAMQEAINEKRSEIANGVTYEGWGQFTDKELTILYSLSHEADYTNENILTTNLDDIVTSIDVEKELLEDAQKRLFEKSRPQYSFSTTLDNILSVNGFEPLRSHVKLLNYFYLKYGLFDDETLKLRIVKITFNPFIENEELSLEFSNMTYTYDGINDYYYLYENMNSDSSSGSGSSGSSSGGGTYGENDAEITLSNNMLNALLKNESTSSSFNLKNMLSTKQIENLIVVGDLRVDGAAITNLIKSKNYNGSDAEILDNTQGSVLDLKDGTFNFGGGGLVYNQSDGLKVKGDITSGSTISGVTISGSTIESGTIKSQNYNAIKHKGSILNLDDGTFSFGDDSLTYNNSELSIKGNLLAGIIQSLNKTNTINLNDNTISLGNGGFIVNNDNSVTLRGNIYNENTDTTQGVCRAIFFSENGLGLSFANNGDGIITHDKTSLINGLFGMRYVWDGSDAEYIWEISNEVRNFFANASTYFVMNTQGMCYGAVWRSDATYWGVNFCANGIMGYIVWNYDHWKYGEGFYNPWGHFD